MHGFTDRRVMNKLRAIFLYVFVSLVQIVSSAAWTAPMVANYFKAKNVHSVDAFLCSSKDASDIFQYFTKTSRIEGNEYITLSRVVRSLDLSTMHHGQHGIFFDLSCADNQQHLMQIVDAKWFESNLIWLIWDQIGFLDSSGWSLPVSTFSHVTLANYGGLTKLRKVWKSLPIEYTNSGKWDSVSNEVTLLQRDELQVDLRGSTVKGVITFIQDIYDRNKLSQQLQEVNYKPGFDIVNRFYHSNVLLLGYLYNFKLDLTISDNWGDRSDNGTWSGMLGLLQRGEVDLSLTPMLPVSQRVEVSTPTLALVPYWIAVVFKQPRALGTYKAMILELSLATWICVIALIVVGAFAFSITQKFEPDPDPTYDTDASYGMGIVLSVGIIANQGLCLMPKGTSSRIVCLSLLVVGLIVSTYYSAATMTALLSPSAPIIKTLDQLIKNEMPVNFRNASYIRLLKVRGRLFSEQILKLMDTPNLKLWELCAGTQSILNGSAFVDEYFVLFQNINSQFKSDVICDLTVFNTGYYSFVLHFVKKDSHFKEMHLRGLIRLLEHGLVQKERQRWITNRLSCSRVVEFIHVHMEAVSVALGLFVAGFVLSIIFYIFEVLLARSSRRSRKLIKRFDSAFPGIAWTSRKQYSLSDTTKNIK